MTTAASKPVVLMAEKLAPSTLEVFGDEVEIRSVDGTDRAALLEAVADADALLVRSATQVDAEVFDAAKQLKIVGRAGVGLDNVEVPAATSHGVMGVNAPTSNNGSAAEVHFVHVPANTSEPSMIAFPVSPSHSLSLLSPL